MQMAFEQSLKGTGMIARRESGQLYLAKPGKMLWHYSEPAGKMFLVDGKSVWFYTPNTNRVEHSPVKQSDDMRAPLAFLLGELDFQKYFDQFRTKPEGDSLRITAAPKSKRAPYSEVEFVVSPEYDIRSLKVSSQDGSVMQFGFSQVTPGPKLDAKLFQFAPPAGAELVEVEAQ
jgi:outer membrane lipoprotein carrier protein